jgi:hypothetical protein
VGLDYKEELAILTMEGFFHSTTIIDENVDNVLVGRFRVASQGRANFIEDERNGRHTNCQEPEKSRSPCDRERGFERFLYNRG